MHFRPGKVDLQFIVKHLAMYFKITDIASPPYI